VAVSQYSDGISVGGWFKCTHWRTNQTSKSQADRYANGT